MEEIEQELKKAKDYQLKTLIEQFTSFKKKEWLVNTSDSILSIILSLAHKELRRRTTVEEIYPVEEVLDNRDFVD